MWVNVIETNQRKRGSVILECTCECGNIQLFTKSNFQKIKNNICRCNLTTSRMLPFGEAAKRQCYKAYKHNATRAGREFSLTEIEFHEITQKDCYYCEAQPSIISKPGNYKKQINDTGSYLRNGIDRKNNEIGYTLENSLPCCTICNRAKKDMVFEDFMVWINKLKGAK